MTRQLLALLFGLCILAVSRPAVAAEDWPVLTPDDLKLTSEQVGGADAIILYHTDLSDDNKHHRVISECRKILTERGRRYGTVKLTYDRSDDFEIIDVKARTISPGGEAVDIAGKVYESTELKGRGIKVTTKSFAFPNVQVGSILELQYTEIWDSERAVAPFWVLQEELPQKYVKFDFVPYQGSRVVLNDHGVAVDPLYTAIGLPQGTTIKPVSGGMWELEMRDIPAYVPEPYSPPEDAMMMRVHFYYGDRKMTKPDEFWKQQGKSWSKKVEKFIGHSNVVAQAAAGIVVESDPPEQKARKIYAAVQQLTNLSYSQHTIQELRAESRNPVESAEDVLQRKRGKRDELTRLFIAMARAVGLQVYAMRVATRDDTFFNPAMPDERQLNSEIAILQLADGKEVYLDPGTRLCPFGMLQWSRTGVQGVRQTASGETQMAQTPDPDYKQNMTQHVGQLHLESDGTLRGAITVAWNGQDALEERIRGSKTDDAGRKKQLEDELKELLPGGSTVSLTSQTAWNEPDRFLQATFNVEIPGWVSSVGKRLVMPSVLLSAAGQPDFLGAERKQPVYLPYPYWTLDNFQIVLPPQVQVETVPQTPPEQTPFASYKFQRTASGNILHLRREFAIAGIAFPLQDYPALRSLYGKIKAGDEEPVVLRHSPVQAAD